MKSDELTTNRAATLTRASLKTSNCVRTLIPRKTAASLNKHPKTTSVHVQVTAPSSGCSSYNSSLSEAEEGKEAIEPNVQTEVNGKLSETSSADSYIYLTMSAILSDL